MHKLIEFLRRTYVVALFILLEAIAIGYYAHSSSYTRARLLTTSNHMLGGLQGVFSEIRGYFSLRSENDRLVSRITVLETTLAHYRWQLRGGERDSLLHDLQQRDTLLRDTAGMPYAFAAARIVANSINRTHNFMTLDRGTRDGVTEGMGVLSPDGAMVGYVSAASSRHAVVLSILNTSFRASGKISGSNYFGSIYWDGSDRYHVRMKELSKYAEIQVGDAVVSTGFSQYFPADILIGYVERYELSENQMSYDVEIRLAVDVSGLTDVILVSNSDAEEVRRLETYRRGTL